MHKHYLTIAALAITTAAQAQSDSTVGLRYPTQKGTLLAGADVLLSSIGFGSDGPNTAAFYDLGFNPRATYMLSDHFAAGVTLNGQAAGQGSYKYYTYGGGIYARYYFAKAIKKNGSMRQMRYYLEAGVNAGSGTSAFRNGADGWDRYKVNYITPNATAGFSYFITPKVALDGGLNFSTNHYFNSPGPDINNHNSLGIRFGLQFVIGGKR